MSIATSIAVLVVALSFMIVSFDNSADRNNKDYCNDKALVKIQNVTVTDMTSYEKCLEEIPPFTWMSSNQTQSSNVTATEIKQFLGFP